MQNRENYTDNYGSSCNVSQENLTEPYSTCVALNLDLNLTG